MGPRRLPTKNATQIPFVWIIGPIFRRSATVVTRESKIAFLCTAKETYSRTLVRVGLAF